MRRTFCLLLVTLGLLYGVACAPVTRHSRTLQVLVFNVHAGKDAAGQDRLGELASLVRSTAADIVLLQEVDRGTNRSGKVDQLQSLIDNTRYQGVFGRSLDYDGGQY